MGKSNSGSSFLISSQSNSAISSDLPYVNTCLIYHFLCQGSLRSISLLVDQTIYFFGFIYLILLSINFYSSSITLKMMIYFFLKMGCCSKITIIIVNSFRPKQKKYHNSNFISIFEQCLFFSDLPHTVTPYLSIIHP